MMAYADVYNNYSVQNSIKEKQKCIYTTIFI